MKTIGVLFTGYNTEKYVEQSLQTWANAKLDRLMGYEFLISAVSVPFLEYKDDQYKDSTQDILWEFYNGRLIDHLITEPEYVKEHIARDKALQWLLSHGVDTVILWDSDEIATESQLEEILTKVELDRWTSWFSIQYRNFIFDGETYLEQPFTPPRIFRVNTNGHALDRFAWDNDPVYCINHYENGQAVKREVSYKELPSKLIRNEPVKHMTWLHENGKRKVEYQLKHFNGICGYKWNEEKNCLEFNDEYYKKIGQPIPRTMKISS